MTIKSFFNSLKTKNWKFLDAVKANDTELAGALLAQGAKIDAADNSYRSALWHAADAGNLDMAKWLIAHGAPLKTRDERTTPLMAAAQRGKIAVAEYLIESCGVKVDERNVDGKTALMLAAREGQPAMVKFLLDKGADEKLTTTRCSGLNALFYAHLYHHPETARLLCEYPEKLARERQIKLAAECMAGLYGAPPVEVAAKPAVKKAPRGFVL